MSHFICTSGFFQSGNIVGAQFVGREKKEERKKEIWRELDGIFEAVLKV